MKLSLPALLDAGRRFTARLAMPRIRRQAFTRQQLRQARRGFFLLGLTVATFIALHPPAAQAQDWSSEHWIGTWGAGPGVPPLPAYHSGDHPHLNDFAYQGYLNAQAPKR